MNEYTITFEQREPGRYMVMRSDGTRFLILRAQLPDSQGRKRTRWIIENHASAQITDEPTLSCALHNIRQAWTVKVTGPRPA